MSNVKKLKPHDRQTIVQNLMTALKKRYKSAVPKHSFTLLESLIFAALLEDSSESEAREAYDRLLDNPDPDLWDWIAGLKPVPPDEDGPVMRALLAHCARGVTRP